MTITNTDKFFVSDKPCRYGHVLRFKASGHCVECERQRDRERYARKVAAQGHTVRPQSAKGSRKTPAEVLSGAVELLKPKEDAAALLLRQIASEVDIGGPVFEMFHTGTRHQLADYNKRCRVNLPPLPPSAKQTRPSWP